MSKAYHYALLVVLVGWLAGCSAGKEVVTETPVTQAAVVESAETEAEEMADMAAAMSEEEALLRWVHMDGMDGKFSGAATDKVYSSLLANKKPRQTVIVAVIDSGIDIEHEDLNDVIWVNRDEVAGNGIDDDNNGYIDDVHGWNFIGGADGTQVDFDTYEVTREYVRLSAIYENVDPGALSADQQEEYAYYEIIVEAFETQRNEMIELKANFDQAIAILNAAHNLMSNHLGKTDYTIDEVQAVSAETEELQQAQSVLLYFDSIDIEREQLAEEYKTVVGWVEKGYNPDFDPRGIVGDNYDDPTERYYGNNSVEGPDASHGTHVAGIIAAERGNGVGMDGVANAVEIMPIRAVPNGDERDKDVANAIRYAVDNGARIINMSFGKDFSSHKEVVDEAILYAEANNVLMVHAAGNDGADNDAMLHFPIPEIDGLDREVRGWIEVGASNWEGGDMLPAEFSNYGQESVDLFAPGVNIYSTTPDDSYESNNGTSMAAPVVSGVAALIMAYYPEFSADEVKQILLESAVPYKELQVVLPGSEDEMVAFGTLSQTGGVVNAFRALEMAERKQ